MRIDLISALLLHLSDDVSKELGSGAGLQLVDFVVFADKVDQSALAWRVD